MWGTRALCCLAVFLVAGSAAHAGDLTFPERPDGATRWIVDAAGMLDAGDAGRVNAIARELLRDKQIPVLVVTIPTLGDYGSRGSSIASNARALFDAWGIGSEAHNHGMLLLVAERV